ncbi:MAG: arginine transporter [Yoonia sp.]|uniref:arginine transporter n=1 Tax=Rhodobacterales TaxID=204455 RepID=UPI001FF38F69|nr:arginine transporter [Loktanella sp. F6476L]MCK0119189.1 arginine transporter [Loktanella sp. F6476L]UWR00539.1 arginine transporter [Rhodobacteraceae bacterium S2214]
MRRAFVTLSLVALTAACSSGVNGKVGKACIDADRSAASNRLCSCVQRVADQSLSGSDQSLAVKFFEEPQLAQDTRQSDNPRSEAFWQRYRAFANSARRQCG